MLPGIQQRAFFQGNSVVIDTAREDVDLWDDLGQPSFPIDLTVYILGTGIITSSDPTIPALKMDGFSAGSIVTLFLEGGEIRGAGGAGGRGQLWVPTSPDRGAGGGGGGGGTIVGPGGPGGLPAADGTDGLAETGGAGGSPTTGGDAGSGFNATSGQAGGDAIFADQTTLILNPVSGLIWGGGGGGGGGGGNGEGFGGNGGTVGQSGTPGTGGGAGNSGAGGYAARGDNVTELAGAADIRGTVGP